MEKSTTNTSGVIAAAAKKTAVKNDESKTLKGYIKKYKDEIALALPSVITPERFSRIVVSAVSKTPLLAKCEVSSFLGAMLASAQLGLEPNTPLGQAYLIPYFNSKKNVYECQFQIGYKGLIDLARRSGDIKTIEAHIVYSNDEFVYELGVEPKLIHKPCMGERGEMTCVYAVYHTISGGYAFEVMSKAEVEKHRKKYSKAKSSPWDSEFEEMAKKTVLKKLLKYAPMKSDYIKGTVIDSQNIKFDNDTSELNVVEDDVIDESANEETNEE